jgi:hypothetical protein
MNFFSVFILIVKSKHGFANVSRPLGARCELKLKKMFGNINIMKIIFKQFNIAPFISKTWAPLEREIIQVIIDFDSTLYKNDFFSIISTYLRPEFKF